MHYEAVRRVEAPSDMVYSQHKSRRVDLINGVLDRLVTRA